MFTAEQQEAINAIVAAKVAEATKAATTPPAAPTPSKNEGGEEKPVKSVAEEAKAQIEAEKLAASNLATIQSSIKFNLGVNDFVEKNKSNLPEEAGRILTALSTKTFKDENERANTVRKSLLDSFLSQKENIECLTPTLATRANEYKALAESDKEKRSSEFWDLAETGIALKQGRKKAEALNQINGVAAGEESKNVIASKILAAAKERFKPVQL